MTEPKRTPVTPADLVILLNSTGDPQAKYTLVHELRHAGSAEQSAALEPLLDESEEPFLARIALETLTAWGLAWRYRDRIREFVRGVGWDAQSGGYVRLVALSAAGELLASARDEVLIREVLEVVEDEGANIVARDAAYAALLLATGSSPADLPPATRLHGPASYDQEVIRNARMLAGRQ